MILKIEKINDNNESEALDVLVKAIYADPTKILFFHDDADRLEHTTYIVRKMVKILRSYGYAETLTLSGKVVGTAVWVPPGVSITYWELVKVGLLTLPFRIGLRRFARIMSAMNISDKIKSNLLNGRKYWQLEYLGIHPDHQGKGYGSKLLAPILKEAEQSGVPVFLQNFTIENTRFYEKNGFNVARLYEFKKDIVMRNMIREPKIKKQK